MKYEPPAPPLYLSASAADDDHNADSTDPQILWTSSQFKAGQAETMSDRENRLRNRNLKKEPWKPKRRSDYTKEEWDEVLKYLDEKEEQYLEEEKQRMLEKSERLAREEKEEPWPPVWKPIKECILYKNGLIPPFVDKRWDFEDMNDSEFDSKPKYAALRSKYGHDVLNKLKTFLRQVRETRGYDVDWCPPPFMRCPFRPDKNVHELMKKSQFYLGWTKLVLEFADQRINARAKNHGEEYRVLDIQRVVDALSRRYCLITFSVELIKDGRVEDIKDVQALMFVEGGQNYDCVEWRFKPREGGPSTDPILERPAKRKRKPPSCNQGCIRRSTRLSNTCAADSKPPKKKKTKRETNSAKALPSLTVNSSRTIVIEHSKRNSFKMMANHVKEALEGDVNVVVNPEKPRRGWFEIREEGGEVLLSLPDMKRPLKAPDMEKLIADIVEKIRG